MSREVGVLNKRRSEYENLYETYVIKYKLDPVDVLFKLMRSRNQAIKIQAAKAVLEYRFPKQAAVAVAVESASQLVMSWGEQSDEQPAELMDLERDDSVIQTIEKPNEIPL